MARGIGETEGGQEGGEAVALGLPAGLVEKVRYLNGLPIVLTEAPRAFLPSRF